MHSIRASFGVVFVSVLAALPVWAQEPAAMERCRSITNDVERLGCYDKLAVATRPGVPPSAGRGYRTVGLTDLKLDHDQLRGQNVVVAGDLVLAGEMALLRSGTTDASPIFVDLKAVPREQQRALLERCTALGCAVTLHGRVDRVMEQRAIVADGAELR